MSIPTRRDLLKGEPRLVLRESWAARPQRAPRRRHHAKDPGAMEGFSSYGYIVSVRTPEWDRNQPVSPRLNFNSTI